VRNSIRKPVRFSTVPIQILIYLSAHYIILVTRNISEEGQTTYQTYTLKITNLFSFFNRQNFEIFYWW
jgi:hypothetical protein